MRQFNRYVFLVLAGLICGVASSNLSAAELTSDAAWKALLNYDYGQDMAPLLRIDLDIIQAMQTAETRAQCAQRLAGVLTSPATTIAAKQFVCLKLRQIGTADQVPALAKLLEDPNTFEMARQALESIPGNDSTTALRDALSQVTGRAQIGVINSLAVRRDVDAIPALQELTRSADSTTAAAARHALSKLIGEEPDALPTGSDQNASVPTDVDTALLLLRYADAKADQGDSKTASAIFETLSQTNQPHGVRRAALEGLVRLAQGDRTQLVLAWFAGADTDYREIAAQHLQTLSDDELDRLLNSLDTMTDGNKLAVIQLAVSRRGHAMLPTVLALVRDENPTLKLAGLRCLGLLGDASAIPLLVNTLGADEGLTEAARQALLHLPRKEVTAALLDALMSRPSIRPDVIDVLIDLKCYDAIDPLIEIALQPDATIYGPALTGLRGIADPDKTDMPRLVKLLLKTQPGAHRDEVEKTILIVAEKLPPKADRAELVLQSLSTVKQEEMPKYLPVLGRLGGKKALQTINDALQSQQPDIQDAAVRALCNWPNADVAESLYEIASESPNRSHARWALRAYIRVITLKSDRPEAETLTMLQNAMKLATTVEDQRLALERASTIRTMNCVLWIADYLDDSQLEESACAALVELAHHRFLRHPNMDRFGPILDKVARVSKDATIVERAKRYRLGL